MMDWPSQSPDLNPIEHLWTELKQRLWAAPTATSIDELWERVQCEWWAVDSEVCLKLVGTMPKRISDVIKHRETIQSGDSEALPLNILLMLLLAVQVVCVVQDG